MHRVVSEKDLNEFFKKFMTIDERNLIFRRLAVVKLLKQGKQYRKIKGLLNISGDTISGAKDILVGIGYNKNPNKKRQYTQLGTTRKREPKPILPKYKWTKSIFLFQLTGSLGIKTKSPWSYL